MLPDAGRTNVCTEFKRSALTLFIIVETRTCTEGTIMNELPYRCYSEWFGELYCWDEKRIDRNEFHQWGPFSSCSAAFSCHGSVDVKHVPGNSSASRSCIWNIYHVYMLPRSKMNLHAQEDRFSWDLVGLWVVFCFAASHCFSRNLSIRLDDKLFIFPIWKGAQRELNICST